MSNWRITQPDLPGIYKASYYSNNNVVRYWNGKYWSMPVYIGVSGLHKNSTLNDLGKRTDVGDKLMMYWSDEWVDSWKPSKEFIINYVNENIKNEQTPT